MTSVPGEKFIERLRAYSKKFDQVLPPLLSRWTSLEKPLFPWTPNSESGVRILLFYSALYQDIREDHLTKVLQNIYLAFPDSFFQVHQISFVELQQAVNKIAEPYEWNLRSKVPGILRSVCDYFLMKPNLMEWIHQVEESEEIVEDLSTNIFFMGKSSPSRFKARYFVWLLLNVFPDLGKKIWTKNSRLPVTAGAQRLLHFIGPLAGIEGKTLTPEKKLEYYNQYYRKIYPTSSWKMYLPMSMYRTRAGKNSFECQNLMKGCPHCPIDDPCND